MRINEIRCPTNGDILHVALSSATAEALAEERHELIDPGNFLQSAVIQANKGKAFAAHFHLERSRTFENLKAQEAWVVLRGKVRVTFFDRLQKRLGTIDLLSGDVWVTLHGGHGYEILEDNTLVIEFKSGPYEGQKLDKRFIDSTG